jgi:phosphoglycerol transferase MdoB-like AlkP superfamily enzyme
MNFILDYIKAHIPQFEMAGVIMRIFCFSLVSWLGPDSPFMLIWIVNTVDAILLTYCATLKKDRAYTLLNGFWILVGILGIARAGGWL